MKKNILIFGLVIGLLLAANAIYHMNLMYSDPDYKGNDVLGYATQILLFSMMYFGIRNYPVSYTHLTLPTKRIV